MSRLRIFHTADVHLGLKFGSYPDELARKLSEARFETLERMVKIANDERCDLFVVGGDLFDHLRVARRDVTRAASILGQFDRAVAVLPGNHDYTTGVEAGLRPATREIEAGLRPATREMEDDLWRLMEGDRLRVLTERRPYSLRPFDLDACLYPAPCQNKHSKTHALDWITKTRIDPEAGRFRIGVAHGSFEELTPDTEGEYYPMTREDLQACGLDLWLMGHIHLQYPARPGPADRVFYPATPEPDGFDCRHEGKAWILELDEKKAVQARSISTGQYRFRAEKARIASFAELEALERRLLGDPAAARTLLKLELAGALERAEHAQVAGRLQALQAGLLFMKADTGSLTLRITAEEIEREFTRGSIPQRLLSELAHDPADAEALQEAWQLVCESRAPQ